MHADAAMDLIVHADFDVGLILAAGKLDAVHAEVGVSPAGMVGVFGVDQRQRDEGAGVVGPAFELRELVDRGFMFEHGAGGDALGEHRPGGAAGFEPAGGIF